MLYQGRQHASGKKGMSLKLGVHHIASVTHNCMYLQVPTVVPEAKKALAEGCAVVIGLQTTGEAAADAMGLEPGQVFPDITFHTF